MVQIKVRPTRRRSVAADHDNTNRESWLIDAVELLREPFRAAGAEIPPVRVSVGWPGGRGGLKIMGRCWKREASSDGAFQVFVSPVIAETVPVLGILIHELCHAATDCQGHSHEFKVLARGIGLDGKLTSTFVGPELEARLNALIVDKLGPYPHAALKPEASGEKKQGTRMVKCVCAETGYTVRTTRQWLASYGPPISPKTLKPMVEETSSSEPKAEEKADENGGDE